MALLPLALLAFYICLFFMGEWLVTISLIILSLGILAGYGQNTMQYMITHAAAEAPDFANALYLLSANLGTMMGAAVCGAFITAFDTRYSVFGSLLFLMLGIVFVALRIRAVETEEAVEIATAA